MPSSLVIQDGTVQESSEVALVASKGEVLAVVHFVVILLRLPGQHLWALAALELGRFVPKFLVVLGLVDVNGLDRDGPVLALLALEGLELRVVVVCLLGPGLVTKTILAS